MPTTVLAAGGIVLRTRGDATEVALIHRPRYDDWSFPKGKLDAGETPEQAALREVHEETALRCALLARAGDVTYLDEAVSPKPTAYWVMRVLADDGFVPGPEIDDLLWVELAAAGRHLSRDLDRSLLRSLPGATWALDRSATWA